MLSLFRHLVLVLVIGGFGTACAQTIELGKVTTLHNCVKDNLVVGYRATGQFGPDNQFFIQLSDPNGSFAPWTNSAQRSSRDTDLLLMPLSSTGDHYRVRVASTNPFVTSRDNGDDIIVINFPNPQPSYSTSHITHHAFEGETVHFADNEPAGSKIAWKFGPDAFPDTSTSFQPDVVFATQGPKSVVVSVTNKFGCSSVASLSLNILTCSPRPPSAARIVTGDASGADSVVWVKAGGNYSADAEFTTQLLFVDPGGQASVSFRSNCLAYVRSGGSLINNDGQGHLIAVLAPGIKIGCGMYGDDCDTVYCQSLGFELGVQEARVPTVRVTQLGNTLYLSSDGMRLNAALFDILGNKVRTFSGDSGILCDISALPGGVYFLQAGDGRDVIVKKILR